MKKRFNNEFVIENKKEKFYHFDVILIYEGDFINDESTGKGKLYDSEENILYVGYLINGIPNGYGKIYKEGILKYEGYFKNNGLIGKCKNYENIILVIDEIHNIIGAGDGEHSMNAANILKPALSNGEIQLIGTTTIKEYRKFIEKDTALERRFQKVIVDITNFDEEQKQRLRGFIKFFTGDTSNMKIFVKEKDKELPCGTIFLNNKILEELYCIANKDNVILE